MEKMHLWNLAQKKAKEQAGRGYKALALLLYKEMISENKDLEGYKEQVKRQLEAMDLKARKQYFEVYGGYISNLIKE